MTATSALITLILGLVLTLALVYWYSNRVKRRLDAPVSRAVLQAPLELDIPESAVAGLLKLSREPLLLKQTEDGARVQLNNRPLVPIAILTDKEAVSCLRRLCVTVSEEYGPRWSALVTVKPEGKAVVQRLT